jgi:hypothetical protein
VRKSWRRRLCSAKLSVNRLILGPKYILQV